MLDPHHGALRRRFVGGGDHFIKIDSAFDNLFVPQPSWLPSTTRNNFASSLLLRTWLPYDWTPRSEAYFVFPLAQGTPGKQCGLAATGIYQPSLRSPWLAAVVSYSFFLKLVERPLLFPGNCSLLLDRYV